MAKVGPQTEEEKKARDFTVPSGRYVLGAEEFERKHSERSGHDFIRVKWFVVGPSSRGKRTRTTQSCDIAKDGTRIRWSFWAEAVGLTEAFEIGDASEGMETVYEGDRNIGRLLMGRAIVVELERSQQNGYWNNDIKRYVPRDKWSDGERRAAVKWEQDFQQQLEQRGAPQDFVDDGPPPDDFESDDIPPPPSADDDDAIPW